MNQKPEEVPLSFLLSAHTSPDYVLLSKATALWVPCQEIKHNEMNAHTGRIKYILSSTHNWAPYRRLSGSSPLFSSSLSVNRVFGN